MHRIPALALGLMLTTTALAACGDDADVTSAQGPTAPAAPAASTASGAVTVERDVLDGTHTAWLTAIEGEQLSLELVEVLTGHEAVVAARADGQFVEGDNLPNDVYVRSIDSEAGHQTSYIIDIADDATVQLYDCTNECELVDVALSDFLDGSRRPYGGDHPLLGFELTDGQITEIVEQYLP